MRLVHYACWWLCAVACLPNETRTPPGALVVELVAADGTGDAVPTSDGWTLTLEQVVANVGRIELTGDGCEAYSEASYTRILDLSRRGPERVALLYGLGSCSPTFALTAPRWNTLVGEGVPQDIETQLRTPGRDGEGEGGVSLYVAGHAEQGERALRFAWLFRAQVQFQDCPRDDETTSTLTLASGTSQRLELELDARELFRNDAGRLEFSALADAAERAGAVDGSFTLAALSAEPAAPQTLLHELYYTRLTRLIRVAAGSCAGRTEVCADDCDD